MNNFQKGFEPKVSPASKGWFSLGPGRGIKWALWNTNVSLQRQEKENDSWMTKEEFHISPKVLKEISWRIPSWLEHIESNGGESE